MSLKKTYTFNIQPDDNTYIIGPATVKINSSCTITDLEDYENDMVLLNDNIELPYIFDHSNSDVKLLHKITPIPQIFMNPDKVKNLRTYWYADRNVYITYNIELGIIVQIVEMSINHSDDYVLYHFANTLDHPSNAVYIEMTDSGKSIAIISGTHVDSKYNDIYVDNIQYTSIGLSRDNLELNYEFNTGYQVGKKMPTSKELFIYYIIEPDVEDWIHDLYNP